MFTRLRKTVAASAATVIAACLLGPAGAAGAEPRKDILDELKRIPGLTVLSEGPPPTPEHRYFVLSYTQPVDHRQPGGATFQQRFQLVHKAVDRPMVLHTTGYNLYPTSFRGELTQLVDGNQISTEHRFFPPSRPEPSDWSHLTVWQAASDHHRLVSALKPLYPRRWLATGASKGGMASVYHNRFYPRDVDGVVAYVAPNDHVNDEDSAYDRFFATVGDPACRSALADLQVEAFKRRPELLALLTEQAAKDGWTFDKIVGSADRVFEKSAMMLGWAFWQYFGQAHCAKVPATTSATAQIYDYIQATVNFGSFADQNLGQMVPYYFQAMTELGWPQPQFAHLRGYLKYPDSPSVYSNVPKELHRPHRPTPMLDVNHWVRTDSQRIMFIYGQNDPWSAERFTPSPHDSHSYTAPGSNHGARISLLNGDDRIAATAVVRRWAGAEVGQANDYPAVDPRALDVVRTPLPF
ncbi:S28 family serine protease [Allokutzneria albata]|uniref:PS-10 peptidase S37 n=1 Tax=Allokutzneria albata TaxID=211114 RepID=A0A1G9SZT5_ALLAB|nr:S28 family serine protease [Allokutzneria albata]SDM40892.1 PS-10 peptidase S37 [Allokutzneria albata]